MVTDYSKVASETEVGLIIVLQRHRTLGDRAFPAAAVRAWNSLSYTSSEISIREDASHTAEVTARRKPKTGVAMATSLRCRVSARQYLQCILSADHSTPHNQFSRRYHSQKKTVNSNFSPL